MSRHKALITRTKRLGGIALRATFAALFVLSAAPVAAITSPESLHTVYAQATDDIDAITFDAFMTEKNDDFDTNTELQKQFSDKQKEVLTSLKKLLRENLNNFKNRSAAATFGEIPVDDRYTNIQRVVKAWQKNPFDTGGYYRYLKQMTGNDGEKILSCAHRDSFLSDGNSHIDDRYNLWWACRSNVTGDILRQFITNYYALHCISDPDLSFGPTLLGTLDSYYYRKLLDKFGMKTWHESINETGIPNPPDFEHHKDYWDDIDPEVAYTLFRARRDAKKSVWFSDRIVTSDTSEQVFLRTQFAWTLENNKYRQCWDCNIPLHCLGTFVKQLRVSTPSEKIYYVKPKIWRRYNDPDGLSFLSDPESIYDAVKEVKKDEGLKQAIKHLFKPYYIAAMKNDCSISRKDFEQIYEKASVDFCGDGMQIFDNTGKLKGTADASYGVCFAISVPGLQTQIYPLHSIWQSLDDAKAAASKKIAAMEIPQELKTSSIAEIAKAQDQNAIDAVVDNAAAKDTNAPAEEDSGTCPSQTSDASTQTVEDTKTTDTSTQTDENASTTQSADTSTQTDAGTGSPSNTGSCSTSCAGAIAPSTTNGDAKPTLMYRLYNPYSHEHLFSTDTCERNYLTRIGWKDEGIVGAVSLVGTEGGVYRLYNSSTGEHHYTSDTDELKRCVDAGWKNEGIMFYSQGDVKMVSMYNPYEKKFYHHYTSDEDEIAKMVKAGWKREEVKWRCSSRW